MAAPPRPAQIRCKITDTQPTNFVRTQMKSVSGWIRAALHHVNNRSFAGLTASSLIIRAAARRWASGAVAQMHLQLQADDLWRREYKQLHFPTAGRFFQEVQVSFSTSFRVHPSHNRFIPTQLISNFTSKPCSQPKSRLIFDPQFPDAVFAQTQHGPRLRISSRLPFHEPAIAHAANFLRTRAIKTHRIRLISLNVWHATTHHKPVSHTTPAHRHTTTYTTTHDFTMKYFQQSVDFDYSWEEVSTSNWQKYGPWNEKTPHVIAVDTLSRTVDPSTGILRTERLITCQQSAPKWVTAILGGVDTSMVYETSYVDPVAKKLTMTSMNITWADLLQVRETCVYTPNSAAPSNKTSFTQRAEITAFCGGWQKIKNSIEQFTVDRFQQNAQAGKEGFEMVLERAREVFQEQREILALQQGSRILREAKM